ncbi:hypothetical protein Pan153_06400 [Gimesia panareensis]|uniref:Uncharacterized protein n=1 Tax=Gimesia panareensis TaxID=2527978 RepID=A0A518FIC7_9PLAN|nr:hypothetical protein [Gimesia panareensis]QDV16020.1 hypothetical protein Pan153_06400 [Gimesia panareensis]
MRLTLRTLIAYLDDVLEPAQIKEIGQKLEESGYASSLVERIKDVLRRRRLTAPEVEGPGSNLDPNTVAEYLDNTLPPESVADVEKICLNSDVNLVEVAASHQILTLVLGEPATINPDTRERIYALGPAPQSEQVEIGPLAQTAVAEPSPAPATTAPTRTEAPVKQQAAPAQAPEPFSSRIPDYLKTKPLWKRFTPYFLVLTAAVVWAGLFFGDPTFFPSFFSQQDTAQEVAVNGADNQEIDLSQPQEPAAKQPAAEKMEPAAATTASEKQPAKTTPAAAQPKPEGETVAMNTKPPAFDAPPPADAETTAPKAVPAKPPVENLLPAPSGTKAETVKPAAPPSTPPASPVKPDDKTVAMNSKPPENAAPAVPAKIEMADAAAKAPAAQIESEDGFFLAQVDQKRELADKNDWLILSKVMPIQAGSAVASPEPFTARINIPEALCKVVLLPGTAVTYQGKNKAAEMGFKIQEGRLRIEASRGLNDARDAAGPTLSIKVNDELWRIELVTRDSVCGIEIDPVQPTHPDQKPGPDNYTGMLYAYSGMIRFSDGSGKVHTIDAGHWMSLSAKDRKAGLINPSDRVKPLRVPHWVEPNYKDNSYLTRRQLAAFSKELKDDQLVSLTMSAITKDLKPNTSDLATKALALTNRYQELVKVLDEVDHHESRMEAFNGIRNWLLRDQENGELLSTALKKQFSPEMAETMERLLWGFQKEDAEDRFISSRLVEWLEHPHVAVREFAFNYIHQLTDRPIDYSDIATPTQRRSTARRWFSHIDKHGSLIEPQAAPVNAPEKIFNPAN